MCGVCVCAFSGVCGCKKDQAGCTRVCVCMYVCVCVCVREREGQRRNLLVLVLVCFEHVDPHKSRLSRPCSQERTSARQTVEIGFLTARGECIGAAVRSRAQPLSPRKGPAGEGVNLTGRAAGGDGGGGGEGRRAGGGRGRMGWGWGRGWRGRVGAGPEGQGGGRAGGAEVAGGERG